MRAVSYTHLDVYKRQAYDVTGEKESTLTGTDGKAYRYKSTTGNPTGSVVEGTTEVTYVYEEVKGSVVVKYVNESGQEVKASETVMSLSLIHICSVIFLKEYRSKR